MTKHAALTLGVLLQMAVPACAGQRTPSGTTDDEPRVVNVLCNSTVGHDTGACQPRAERKCGGKARLLGVVSSVEMTGRPTGRLYMITARYQCIDA